MKINKRQFLGGTMATVLERTFASRSTPVVANQTFLPTVLRAHDDSRLNIITILFDSLRYDYLGLYGNSWIHTPNFDSFAQQAQVFDHAYMGGFPTLLNRAELFTGQAAD